MVLMTICPENHQQGKLQEQSARSRNIVSLDKTPRNTLKIKR